MKFVFPIFIIIFGIAHILSIFIKYPGVMDRIFDTNKILNVFVIFPVSIRLQLSKVVIGGFAIGLGIFLLTII